jgi:hypothetical protein
MFFFYVLLSLLVFLVFSVLVFEVCERILCRAGESLAYRVEKHLVPSQDLRFHI